MSEHAKRVEWFGRIIWLDETYFVVFPPPEKRKKLTKKQRETAEFYAHMPPGLAKWRSQAKINPRHNPNITAMKGWDVIALGEQGYIPQFDRDFDDRNTTDIMRAQKEQAEMTARKNIKGFDRLLSGERTVASRQLTLIPPGGAEFFLDRALLRHRLNNN